MVNVDQTLPHADLPSILGFASFKAKLQPPAVHSETMISRDAAHATRLLASVLGLLALVM